MEFFQLLVVSGICVCAMAAGITAIDGIFNGGRGCKQVETQWNNKLKKDTASASRLSNMDKIDA